MKKILMSLGIFMMFASMGFVSAITTEDSIIAGADRLVTTQNNDGGWDWDPVDEDPEDTSPKNTIGVTALGLLDAYELTGNSSYLDAAKDAAAYIDSATDSERIRGPDITFLVELSEITGNSSYANLAKTEYLEALEDNGDTATSLVESIRDARVGQGWSTLVAWDINLYVQGALALNRSFPSEGFNTNASAMTEVIYEFMYGTSPFNFSNHSQYNVWLIYTGAIEAFATTGLHSTERDTLVSELVASQDTTDGSFSADDTYAKDDQTTAYAVMALLKVVGEGDSANKAAKFLRSSQGTNGGWSDDYENNEVTSEAIQALADNLDNEQYMDVTINGVADFYVSGDISFADLTPGHSDTQEYDLVIGGANTVDLDVKIYIDESSPDKDFFKNVKIVEKSGDDSENILTGLETSTALDIGVDNAISTNIDDPDEDGIVESHRATVEATLTVPAGTLSGTKTAKVIYEFSPSMIS